MTLMPHLSQPISAPQTPVTATHVLGMERCRSSEPVLGNPFAPDRERKLDLSRGGRGRDIKATSLLFKTVPSTEQIQSTEKGEWHHIEGSQPKVEQDLRMDIDGEDNETEETQEEDQPTVWGMPRWGCENERGGEVRKGVRLVGMEEVRVTIFIPSMMLIRIAARFDIPTPTHRYTQSRPLPMATRDM
jgi:dual specificity MAP kinase phosphatase